MEKEELNLFRAGLDEMTGTMSGLRQRAAELIDAIDQGIIPDSADTDAFSAGLREYGKQLAHLVAIGGDLSLQPGMTVSQARTAASEYEAYLKRMEDRGFILDYFRLNTRSESYIADLCKSKQRLAELCRGIDDSLAILEPYRVLVEAVRNGISPEYQSKLPQVGNEIGNELLVALFYNQLFLDEGTDISGYLDGSCDLLMPLGDNQGEEVPEEAIDHQDQLPEESSEEELPGENEPAGTEEEELLTDDDFEVVEVSIDELGADVTDSEEEELSVSSEESVVTYDGILSPASLDFKDVPAKDLNSSKFRNEIKNYTGFAELMGLLSFEKLLYSDSEADMQKPELYKEAFDHLIEAGYVIPVKLNTGLDSALFYGLSSKGYAAFARKDTHKMLEESVMLCDDLSNTKPQQLTPAFLANVAIIKEMSRHFKSNYPGLLYQPLENTPVFLFRKKDTDKNYEVYPAFCPTEKDGKVNSEWFLLLADLIDTTENSKIVLVRSESDAFQLKHVLSIRLEQGSEKKNVDFRIVARPDAFMSSRKGILSWREIDILAGVVEEDDDESSVAYIDDNVEIQETVLENAQAEVLHPEQQNEAQPVEKKEQHGTEAESVDGDDEREQPAESAQPVVSPVQVPVPDHGTESLNEDQMDLFRMMLREGKFYCASAFLAALAKNDVSYQSGYTQLAYALNDPMAKCSYSSKRLFDVYFSERGLFSDYFLVSAAVRNFFLDDTSYDYEIHRLNSALDGNGVYQVSPKTKSLARRLMDFKKENNRGIDFYADYRHAGAVSAEENLREICADAAELYEALVEGAKRDRASNARFLEAKKIVFSRDGDLAQHLSLVARNQMKSADDIRTYLSAYILKDDSAPDEANIDLSKIDEIIDDAWNKAQDSLFFKKNKITLTGGLRQNLRNQITKAAVVLIDYVKDVEAYGDQASDGGRLVYRKIKNTLLQELDGALSELAVVSVEETPEVRVLIHTLQEVQQKLLGIYSDNRKYYYLPFLMTEDVLLDEEYIPYLYNVTGVPELSARDRILRHFNRPAASLTERLNKILSGDDDYGSAALIVQYLGRHGDADFPVSEWKEKLLEGVSKPASDLEDKVKEFEAHLELAQYYGQIDNATEDRKEMILQTVVQWSEITQLTENYGFFNKILAGYKGKILEDSESRGKELENNLNAFRASVPDWEKDPRVKGAVEKTARAIRVKNYTAAEDMLNRLQADDIDVAGSFLEDDYLDMFLQDYPESQRSAARSSSKYVISFPNSKEGRGGKALVDNWPLSNGVSAGKIEILLKTLGFPVGRIVAEAPYDKIDVFSVTLAKPSNGRKSNYTHPIAVFGSVAEDASFRVACIYGKRKAPDLVELFNRIGNAKNTIVLLDDTLTVGTRRELARRAKKDANGKTFIVVDRVVIAYLARHYSDTTINRALMAITVPFAYYQPYVAESTQMMPPEMFMGRKMELEKIESPTGVNIVYGGRQLGKSALLKMAQKDINWDENNDRAVLIDIKGLDYKQAAVKIADELYDQRVLDTPLSRKEREDWQAIGRAVKNVLRNGNAFGRIPYLLLLLDEADAFIESSAIVNYSPFDVLKDIQSVGNGRFKFVVAGLRNVVRLKNAALENNSVLAHLSSLTVTPFKNMEARELLEVPLSYLGFRFPEDDRTDMLISNIFSTTNYFPGLLQFFCMKLIEAMRKDYGGYNENNTPPYEIREEHIKKTLADRKLDEQIKEKFMITLKVGGDNYYYLLALLAAFHYHNFKDHNGCSPETLHEIAEEYEIKKIAQLPVQEVSALMEELRELNAFQVVGNGNYRFTRHNFCLMMGTPSEIEEEMLKQALPEE